MLQPRVKDIEFTSTREAMINGEQWIKRNSFVTEMEHLVNHIHIKIDGYNVHLLGNVCFKCGKFFEEQLTSHHSIPRAINPKYNVFVPLCEECHVELNRLYKVNGGEKR